MTPLRFAGLFHDTYETLAPTFGYETRPETRRFNPVTPNGRLMIAVCQAVLTQLKCDHPDTIRIEVATSPEDRMEVGKLTGVTYGLGPGSGILIPLKLCRKCGKVFA
jgi:hypothetical protein